MSQNSQCYLGLKSLLSFSSTSGFFLGQLLISPHLQSNCVSSIQKFSEGYLLFYSINPSFFLTNHQSVIQLNIYYQYPKMTVKASSSPLMLFFLTYISSKVSSSVISIASSLAYIKNCTRLNRDLGSRPVSSSIHLLNISSNSDLSTLLSRFSSTSY